MASSASRRPSRSKPPASRPPAARPGAGTRRLRYQVAASLDGYVAGPNGEHDWIVQDPDIDFAALFRQFDTFLMGRRTFEVAGGQGPGTESASRTFVFSRTLDPAAHRGVTVVPESDAAPTVASLKAERTGKDIWLFGGGDLFRSLAALGLVDRVEIAVIPVLLGGGLPLFPPPASRVQLALERHHVYLKSGIVMLEYAVR